MTSRALEGRKTLVTGGGRGIGAAISEALARDGADVAIVGRAATELLRGHAARLSQAHGVACVALGANLLDAGAADRLLADYDKAFGRLDILINNAGYETTGAAEDLPESELRGVLEVNLVAPFLLAQQAARRMKPGGGGVVINLSSIHGQIPRKGLAHYAASKAGLHMLTRSLALEWAEYGIRVITVSPGAIETDMNREAIAHFGREHFEEWIPAGRLGTVADVAEAVAFLCSDRAGYITGTEIVIDGGYLQNLVRYDDRPGRG
jgi:NAD(P)-dependent dehydrogenase (short-subunit alcohol dehydrogenase family)